MCFKVIILGKPNVGKSCLFNAISEKNLALVKNYSGLTRDLKRIKINFLGKTYCLIDSAGIQKTTSKDSDLNQKILELTMPEIYNSNLILFVVEGNKQFTYEDLENRRLGSDSLFSLGSETFDGNICKVIMAWPKDKSAYFCRKIWVNSQSWRIAKVEYYASEYKKEKTLYVSDFIKKNEFSIAGKMVMEKENGDKTVMEVISYKPDIGLQDQVFTKDFLVKK